MATIEGRAYFCESCPAIDERFGYSDEVRPEDFVIWVDTPFADTPDRTETTAEFYVASEDDGSTHSASKSMLPSFVQTESIEARRLRQFSDPELSLQIGSRICKKIATCQGPANLDGVDICPVYNAVIWREVTRGLQP